MLFLNHTSIRSITSLSWFYDSFTQDPSIPWHEIVELFHKHYLSPTNRNETSSHLANLTLDDVQADGEHDFTILENIRCINTLAPRANPKNLDDELKVRFITSAVIWYIYETFGNEWNPPTASFQKAVNEI